MAFPGRETPSRPLLTVTYWGWALWLAGDNLPCPLQTPACGSIFGWQHVTDSGHVHLQ